MATKKATKTAELKTDVAKATKSVKKAAEEITELVTNETKAAAKDVKKTVEAVAKDTKEVVKTATKTAAKTAKTATKAAKKEVKTSLYVQYFGKEVAEKDMIAAAKKAWTKETGKKVADIKSIALYVKPEEASVYYVINGDDTGRIDF